MGKLKYAPYSRTVGMDPLSKAVSRQAPVAMPYSTAKAANGFTEPGSVFCAS